MSKNTLQIKYESPIVFTAPANQGLYTWPIGTNFIDFRPESGDLPHISDLCDLGIGPRTDIFTWRAHVFIKPAIEISPDPLITNNITIGIYLVESNGIYNDGGFAINSGYCQKLARTKKNGLINLTKVGSIKCLKNSLLPEISSGRIKITSRYFGLVWYADPGYYYINTSGLNYFMLTPVPQEEEFSTNINLPYWNFSIKSDSMYLGEV